MKKCECLDQKKQQLIKKCELLDQKIYKLHLQKCKKDREKRKRIENTLKRAREKIDQANHKLTLLCDSDCVFPDEKCRINNKGKLHKMMCKAMEWPVKSICFCRKAWCRNISRSSLLNAKTICKKTCSLEKAFLHSRKSPAKKKCCCTFEEAHPNMCCTKQQGNRKKPPRRSIYNDKCYLMSLGNTLQSCRCSQPPLCYPDLPTSHLCKMLAHSLLYLLAALIWSPFLLFFIICFSCCCSNHCC